MSLSERIKEFKPSSWAIDNKTSIYVITFILVISGIFAYQGLPKEQFPEVVFPQIYVSTIYPGTSPKNMETLVTKQIEKQVKGINGVKKVTSNSTQDFSNVIVEFSTNVDVVVAKQRVKDAVDKARSDLPTDLPTDPNVIEIDLTQLPILNVNISGNYPLDKLEEYAELAKDRIEGLKEITRVDVAGKLDREIQINIDQAKMASAGISFGDISSAIQYENMNITGGQIEMDGMKRTIGVSGQFTSVNQIRNLVIRSQTGAIVYLRDIAQVVNGYKEKESYARLNGNNVLTLNVVKRSGENLIAASDKIRDIMADLGTSSYPKDLNVVITSDQSVNTKTTLNDLINTIIIGFILVVLILMFFMGTTNAMFVGLSVPLSMCIAFIILPSLGFTMNMIVLFSLLLALGIVVDDAIVVIENTHRLYAGGKIDIVTAAKKAAGEVFLPVFSGTATVIAPFFPLLFWEGTIGEFMFYLPVTLIITLTASLVVAYIINPVFAVDFMRSDDHGDANSPQAKKRHRNVLIGFFILIAVGYLYAFGLGNVFVVILLFYLLDKYVLTKAIYRFQNSIWPAFQERYRRLLSYCLKHPIMVVSLMVALFLFSFVLTAIRQPPVVFFPQSDPNFAFTYIKMPIGTDQKYTDSITKVVENRIFNIIGNNNPIVDAVISNVAIGAGDPNTPSFNAESNKGKVTVSFVAFADRHGASSKDVLDKIRTGVKGIAGAEITVEQEQNGPPTGKPINIEIIGDDFDEIGKVAQSLKTYLQDELKINGIEELKSSLQANKPEISIDINRELAQRYGVSTAQIGSEIRNAVFGKEASKYRDANDEYPIQLRYQVSDRNELSKLINHKIIFRDMVTGGMLRQIPLSAVADFSYTNTYGGISRKDQRRLVTLSSNVLSGYTANAVVAEINEALSGFKLPSNVTVKMTGEQEEQAETGAFLVKALLISIMIILLILVIQFNSVSIALIIISEILLSITGVLLGFSITKMEISVVMTGIGIVALAGIVVRNGILLVEFTIELIERGMEVKEAIIEAARIRMTPVLLTASATMLGLIPLAIGLNINFASLFSNFDSKLHFGGDSVAFWGPLSWTMIFGLGFATIITLLFVPVLFWLNYKTGQFFKSLAK